MDKIKLTMNTLFAGIGCQERGIKNSILFISPRLWVNLLASQYLLISLDLRRESLYQS